MDVHFRLFPEGPPAISTLDLTLLVHASLRARGGAALVRRIGTRRFRVLPEQGARRGG